GTEPLRKSAGPKFCQALPSPPAAPPVTKPTARSERAPRSASTHTPVARDKGSRTRGWETNFASPTGARESRSASCTRYPETPGTGSHETSIASAETEARTFRGRSRPEPHAIDVQKRSSANVRTSTEPAAHRGASHRRNDGEAFCTICTIWP